MPALPKGTKVTASGQLGEIAYVRMAPPTYSEPEAYSVILNSRRATDPRYTGSIFPADQVVEIGPLPGFSAGASDAEIEAGAEIAASNRAALALNEEEG